MKLSHETRFLKVMLPAIIMLGISGTGFGVANAQARETAEKLSASLTVTPKNNEGEEDVVCYYDENDNSQYDDGEMVEIVPRSECEGGGWKIDE